MDVNCDMPMEIMSEQKVNMTLNLNCSDNKNIKNISSCIIPACSDLIEL